MKAPHTIRTERLLLRKPCPEDAAAIFAGYAGDESLGRYLAWPIHRSIEDTVAFLKLADVEWQRWPAGPYLICLGAQERIIGSTGLAFESPHCASTGYVIARQSSGNGYATEAVGAMVSLARDLDCARLVAYCHPDHAASRRVLEKAGFASDALLSDFCEFPNLAAEGRRSVVRYVRTLRRPSTLSVKPGSR